MADDNKHSLYSHSVKCLPEHWVNRLRCPIQFRPNCMLPDAVAFPYIPERMTRSLSHEVTHKLQCYRKQGVQENTNRTLLLSILIYFGWMSEAVDVLNFHVNSTFSRDQLVLTILMPGAKNRQLMGSTPSAKLEWFSALQSAAWKNSTFSFQESFRACSSL